MSTTSFDDLPSQDLLTLEEAERLQDLLTMARAHHEGALELECQRKASLSEDLLWQRKIFAHIDFHCDLVDYYLALLFAHKKAILKRCQLEKVLATTIHCSFSLSSANKEESDGFLICFHSDPSCELEEISSTDGPISKSSTNSGSTRFYSPSALFSLSSLPISVKMDASRYLACRKKMALFFLGNITTIPPPIPTFAGPPNFHRSAYFEVDSEMISHFSLPDSLFSPYLHLISIRQYYFTCLHLSTSPLAILHLDLSDHLMSSAFKSSNLALPILLIVSIALADSDTGDTTSALLWT
jgi:hypothetical protein